MNVSIGPRWEAFVSSVVENGRYESPEAVVREGLRLVQERETRLEALRAELQAAIAEGGEHSDDEVGAAVSLRLGSR